MPDLLNRIISLPVPCGSNQGSPSGIWIPRLSVVRKLAYGVAKSVSWANIWPKCIWKSFRPVLLNMSMRWSQTTLDISRGLDLLEPAGASKLSAYAGENRRCSGMSGFPQSGSIGLLLTASKRANFSDNCSGEGAGVSTLVTWENIQHHVVFEFIQHRCGSLCSTKIRNQPKTTLQKIFSYFSFLLNPPYKVSSEKRFLW